jgi:hypothetical protein
MGQTKQTAVTADTALLRGMTKHHFANTGMVNFPPRCCMIPGVKVTIIIDNVINKSISM